MIPGLDEKLRSLRAIKKYSQELVAERVGIAKSTLSTYENGTATPASDILMKLADVYGVSTDYLLGRDKCKAVIVEGLDDDQVNIISSVVDGFIKANGKLEK